MLVSLGKVADHGQHRRNHCEDFGTTLDGRSCARIRSSQNGRTRWICRLDKVLYSFMRTWCLYYISLYYIWPWFLRLTVIRPFPKAVAYALKFDATFFQWLYKKFPNFKWPTKTFFQTFLISLHAIERRKINLKGVTFKKSTSIVFHLKVRSNIFLLFFPRVFWALWLAQNYTCLQRLKWFSVAQITWHISNELYVDRKSLEIFVLLN